MHTRALISRSQALKIDQFWDPFSTPFSLPFRDPLRDLLLEPFMSPWCSKGGFWDPLWDPAGPKMASKIAQKRPKGEISRKMRSFLGLQTRTFRKDAFRSTPGHDFGRFRIAFGIALADFGIVFGPPVYRHIRNAQFLGGGGAPASGRIQ